VIQFSSRSLSLSCDNKQQPEHGARARERERRRRKKKKQQQRTHTIQLKANQKSRATHRHTFKGQNIFNVTGFCATHEVTLPFAARSLPALVWVARLALARFDLIVVVSLTPLTFLAGSPMLFLSFRGKQFCFYLREREKDSLCGSFTRHSPLAFTFSHWRGLFLAETRRLCFEKFTQKFRIKKSLLFSFSILLF
jgi:hypothetical protein